ncbi:L-aspartate oxidase [Acidaminobacter sp. JC074]|uniref:L-aspartate oxidase n=1 Tax=Acidaminobacter sp. JC074 TaxID=2530199 RepID=UPI001F105199|nr:L-aspartate oxidase [Acidaminobacter sp. JC074]MCH4887382.1 L-aspartate oxidase [Acidaminobacter sp. JC074]
MTSMQPAYDVIIIGSGIAGLFTAMKLDSNKSVLVVSKDELKCSNTNLAQGGVAVTFNPHDYNSHVEDTLKTGFNHNDENRLKIMVEEGGSNIEALMSMGVHFDCDADGNLLLTKEGGHSKRRIVHYKDTTGQEIIRGLLEACLEKDNISLKDHIFVTDLICEDDQVQGVKLIVNDRIESVYASKVVIATGGVGGLYEHTTNASIATADGIAIGARIGAEVADMEFVQFHPTALNKKDDAHFLISEAVRGEGGILRNEAGEAFMERYHPLKDLAPRSVVSKAIIEESNKQGNQNIYLDVTHLPEDYIKNRFPNIYIKCLSYEIDMIKDLIPIVPVQHYMMGGLKTDAIGRTNIKGLYACGEVACTGVHGANRMASNSLLEAIVFANRVAEDINVAEVIVPDLKKSFEAIDDSSCIKSHTYKQQLKHIMSEHVFIFRSKHDLIYALELIEGMNVDLSKKCNSQEAFELRNMIFVSKLIIKAAIARETSLGSHIIEGE